MMQRRNKRKNKLNNEEGFVFVTSLAFMFILLTLGLTQLTVYQKEMLIARNVDDGYKAFYFADTGVQHSIAEILDGTDADGDGLGNIPATDLDGDGSTDYSVNYDSGTKLVTSLGVENQAARTVVVEISTGPWTGAFQIGGQISPAMTLSFSVVNGNVDAGGTIASNFTSQQTINGDVTPNNSSLTIPTTDTSPTGSWAPYADFIHLDCAWLTLNPPAGVHYVDGDCNVNFGSTGPFNLNGSLIVNGDLTLQSVTSGFTITPTGNNPAIVVGTPLLAPSKGNLNLTTLTGVNITGLVYAERNISLNTWEFFGGHDITGAWVAGGDIGLNTIARTNHNFNTNLNPPFFSGGGGSAVTIAAWQGHP